VPFPPTATSRSCSETDVPCHPVWARATRGSVWSLPTPRSRSALCVATSCGTGRAIVGGGCEVVAVFGVALVA
jgi:hypothetical protein